MRQIDVLVQALENARAACPHNDSFMLEQIERALSMAWARQDGYTGQGGYFYGRRHDMPRRRVVQTQAARLVIVDGGRS